MQNFLSKKARSVTPYTAGEQPSDRQYVKLNTNENPYPPSPKALEAYQQYDFSTLNLYPPLTMQGLRQAIAAAEGVLPEQVFCGNGSDEILALCFAAFFDADGDGAAFADITYSFYPVFADFFSIPHTVVPLEEDFTQDLGKLSETRAQGLLVANPNAPTGIGIPRAEIESFVRRNAYRTVIIDEAYMPFYNESAVPLVHSHQNLLVVKTFSKGYSLAGMRCGYAVGSPALIDGLERCRDCFNSYPVDRICQAVCAAAIADGAYYREKNALVVSERDDKGVAKELVFLPALPCDARLAVEIAHEPRLKTRRLVKRDPRELHAAHDVCKRFPLSPRGKERLVKALDLAAALRRSLGKFLFRKRLDLLHAGRALIQRVLDGKQPRELVHFQIVYVREELRGHPLLVGIRGIRKHGVHRHLPRLAEAEHDRPVHIALAGRVVAQIQLFVFGEDGVPVFCKTARGKFRLAQNMQLKAVIKIFRFLFAAALSERLGNEALCHIGVEGIIDLAFDEQIKICHAGGSGGEVFRPPARHQGMEARPPARGAPAVWEGERSPRGRAAGYRRTGGADEGRPAGCAARRRQIKGKNNQAKAKGTRPERRLLRALGLILIAIPLGVLLLRLSPQSIAKCALSGCGAIASG